MMARLTRQQREREIGMLHRGLIYNGVARRTRCQPLTTSRLHQREMQTGTTVDHPRPGQPWVTMEAQDRHIRLSHICDIFRSATHTARETRSVVRHTMRASTSRRHPRERNLRDHVLYKRAILVLVQFQFVISVGSCFSVTLVKHFRAL